MQWLFDLFTQPSVAQSVLLYMLVMAAGIWLGKLRIFGISLGVTWVLFVGLFVSFMGIEVNKEIEHFLKDFGLILFVYSIGLQVGPGFFASLKKNALVNNLLAGAVVLTGVVLTIAFMFFSKEHISVMTGVMSGAVTNTPGLGAAQAAVRDLQLTGMDSSMITLAYAVTYPFGVFGIILTLLLIRMVLGINMEEENERQRKLSIIQSNRPISIHLNLENKGLIGQPLRRLFDLFKEPIVVSRMYHKGEIITPTPDVVLAEGDVLLVVASKMQVDMLKLVIGSPSDMNLKTKSGDLISRIIIVTRNEVTHKRLGDLNELHQHDFTFTRLSRAGVEMVPHGDIFLQLGDTVKVVGTEEGVQHAADALGNSLKRLETPDLAPIFIGVGLGVILGSLPIQFPHMPVPVKIGLAGGPLIIALLLSRFGGALYLNNYTTMSANLMLRELGIGLFLASVGLSSGGHLDKAFGSGDGWWWMAMGAAITVIPLLLVGILAYKVFRKTYFEVCGLLSGASTDPPALAFALKMAGNDIPSATYATVYPLTMILRIVAAELLILLFA